MYYVVIILQKGGQDMTDILSQNMETGGTDEKPRTSKAYQEEEKFLELLRQGKTRKEAYEAIGREKTWASKTIKKIKETDPERLKGTAEEIKEKPQDKPKATQKPKTANRKPQPTENTLQEETEGKPNTKQKRQSFSFRADQNKIEEWKLYAEAIGTKDIGTLWTAAIDEYISNHELTADQKAIYELKRKVAEMQKKT